MKILFFSNVYPIPGQPTRGTFNADLVSALRDAGNDVRCLVPVGWVDRLGQGDTASPDQAAVYRTWFYPPKVLRSQYHRFMAWRLRAPFRRMTRHWHPDIVVAFWIHPDAEVARRLARSIGVPIVAMAGGSDLLVLPQDRRRQKAVARVLQTVDGVITDGQHLARAAIGLGAEAAHVVPFYRGVDARFFAPGDKLAARERLHVAPAARLLVAVGNLVRVKGMDILLQAVALANDQAPWQVALIGDGADRQALQGLAKSLGIADRVRFVGRVPHGDLGDWYRSADLVALASRSEGIPNVLLEALACGTPYIAAAVGGVAEITPDESWLVAPEDAGALASSLRGAYSKLPEVPPQVPRTWDIVAEEFTDRLRLFRNAVQ
jgi:glycosyltransferase involved in cell wall biosynthesis